MVHEHVTIVRNPLLMKQLLKKALLLDKGGTRRGPEGSCMYSSIGEGRASDAGGPRFEPQCPLFHQIHVFYDVHCDM